jgi:hypothetical protein
VPKFIHGIKDECLKLWDEAGAGDSRPDQKIVTACRLAVLCRHQGDKQAADRFMKWAGEQIPLIPKDDIYTREFDMLELALAFWRQGLLKPAEAWAKKLPGFIRDIYMEEVAGHLRKRGQYRKGWEEICRSSESFYQVLYLKLLLKEFSGRKPPLDVPKHLSQVKFLPGDERSQRVYTLMLKYECWMLLKNADQAEAELERAMEEQGKINPEDLLEKIDALNDKLEIARGYFGLGRQHRGQELLKNCRMEHELLYSLSPLMKDAKKFIWERLDGRLASLMALEIQNGSESLAWSLLDQALTEYGKDQIYQQTGQTYIEQLRFKQALETGEKIADDYSLVRFLTELAVKCRWEKMKILSAQAFKEADREAKTRNRWGLWLLMAKAAGEMDDRREELKYLNLAKNCILKGVASEFNLLGHLARAYCRAGQFYLALKLAGQNPDPLCRLGSQMEVWRQYRKKNSAVGDPYFLA